MASRGTHSYKWAVIWLYMKFIMNLNGTDLIYYLSLWLTIRYRECTRKRLFLTCLNSKNVDMICIKRSCLCNPFEHVYRSWVFLYCHSLVAHFSQRVLMWSTLLFYFLCVFQTRKTQFLNKLVVRKGSQWQEMYVWNNVLKTFLFCSVSKLFGFKIMFAMRMWLV